jgi:hypothetical protein
MSAPRKRFVTVFNNVHMGMGHTGLAKMARDARCNPANLEQGELILFLNRKKDKLKIMGGNGLVLGYLRLEGNRRIDMNALQFIPQTFGADGAVNYNMALRKTLSRIL